MATQSEKTEFITCLDQLHQACTSKANDGRLTTDQRNVFLTAVLYLNSDIGKAWNRDFMIIPPNLIQTALPEIATAIDAVATAIDEISVRIAAKELWDANMAIDQVMPE